jgi:hypothetical protein
LHRRLGELGCCGEEKNLAIPGIEPGLSSTSLYSTIPYFTVQVKRNYYRIVSFFGVTVIIFQFRCIPPGPQYW